MHIGVFKITDCDIKFDVFDNERVSKKSDVLHFITPSRIVKAKTWMLENNVEGKMDACEASQLLAADIIGTYEGTK